MAKKSEDTFLNADIVPGVPSVAFHDFYKTNGLPREAHEVHSEGASLTRQEFMEECDINTIMAKYDGYLSDPMRSVRDAVYVDFTAVPSTLMESMQILNEARDAFYRLPALVRREFDNDPALWADFAADPANVEQMREWGLAAPEKVPDAPMKVEVVNPPTADSPPPPVSKEGSTHGST